MLKFFIVGILAVAAGVVALAASLGGWAWWVLLVLVVALLALGIWDVVQRKHSILRNYPILGHIRFLMEDIRPELQQYFIERNYDGRPYDRDIRSLIYERAKDIAGEQAFGTERDVYEPGYEYLVHSTTPLDPPEGDAARPGRRPRLQQALSDGPAQRLGDELRGVVRQRNSRAQQGRQARRLRPRHR